MSNALTTKTTTFDLIVLISLGVVLQTSLLREGAWNAAVFVGTVFVAHRGLAALCARHRTIPGAGHMGPITHPADVNAPVLEHLRSHRAATSPLSLATARNS